MLLYDLLNWGSAIVAFLCFWVFAYYAFSLLKQVLTKKKPSFRSWLGQISSDLKEIRKDYLLVVLVVALCGRLVAAPAIHQLVGVHDLTLKPDGTYCFYVEATPRGGKTYTLPAEIRKSDGNYYIDRVLFSNGGCLSPNGIEAEIGKCTSFTSKDEENWDLVLLNEHAYSPMVEETDNATKKHIFLLVLEVLPIAVFIVLLLRKDETAT